MMFVIWWYARLLLLLVFLFILTSAGYTYDMTDVTVNWPLCNFHGTVWLPRDFMQTCEGLHERTEYLDIFLFSAHHSWCSISDVLFTGGRGVLDFSVLEYYLLNINYSVIILSKCLRILIDCLQLSKTYYNELFSSSTRDRHARRIYLRTFSADKNHS